MYNHNRQNQVRINPVVSARIVILCMVLFLISFQEKELSNVYATPLCTGMGCIGDNAWLDQNRNGIHEVSESGLAGVTVELLKTDHLGNPTMSGPIQSTTTDQLGNYAFDVSAAWYRLKFYVIPTTVNQSLSLTINNPAAGILFDSDPNPITGISNAFEIVSGAQSQNAVQWDAGFILSQTSCQGKWTLGDQIWREINGDGLYDPNIDAPVPGVMVTLWQNWPISEVAWTLTDTNGRYTFSCLDEGEYFIVLPQSRKFRGMTSTYINDTNNPPGPHPGGTDNDNNCRAPLAGTQFSTAAAVSAKIYLGVQPTTQNTLDCALSCDENSTDIVMVVDVSGSMGSGNPVKLTAAKAAASQFVDLLKAPNRRFSIVKFDNNASEVQGLTSNISLVKSAINSLGVGGGTAIQHGLTTAHTILSTSSSERIIILLSDGFQMLPPDNQVVLDAANQAKADNIKILVIGLGNAATQSGGGSTDGNDGIDQPLLTEIATSPQYYRYSPSSSQLWETYKALIPSLCDPEEDGGSCEAPKPEDAQFIALHTGLRIYDVRDDFWRVNVNPGPNPPFGILAWIPVPHSSWPLLNPSRWISHGPTASINEPTVGSPPLGQGGTALYTHKFLFDRTYPSAEMVLDIWADDKIDGAWLNEIPIPVSSDGNFAAAPPARVHVTNGAMFHQGENSFKVRISDTGGEVSGMTAKGWVLGCNGERHPDAPLFFCWPRCGDPELDLGIRYAMDPPISWKKKFYPGIPSSDMAIFNTAIDWSINRWNSALMEAPFDAAPSTDGRITIRVGAKEEFEPVLRLFFFLTSIEPAGIYIPYLMLCPLDFRVCPVQAAPSERRLPLNLIQSPTTPISGGTIVLMYEPDPGHPYYNLPCDEGSPARNVEPLVLHELGHAIGFAHDQPNVMGYHRSLGSCTERLAITPELISRAECMMEQWGAFAELDCEINSPIDIIDTDIWRNFVRWMIP